MDITNLTDIPSEREWTISFNVGMRKTLAYNQVRVDVTLRAMDIHQAIEKACQFYAEKDWVITDVSSYEIGRIDIG